jgi:phospholipase/carboxylesterase
MKRQEQRLRLGGLDAVVVGDVPASRVIVVLHGRLMQATDFAPFAHSLDLDATFVVPDAPIADTARGRCWWPSDAEERALRGGPIDLFALDPPGRAESRAVLDALCREIARDVPLALVGFSQGGMVAMDYVLHGGRADALALLSSSRIAFADWQPRLSTLAGKPVLVAHGHDDDELPFAAGVALRDAAIAGGADAEWLAFDGGHVVPLVVWRALRRFLRANGFDVPRGAPS